jgi:NAD(P)-dependent dehydrogenase (short-subunit alcohol dehydrogenase family)
VSGIIFADINEKGANESAEQAKKLAKHPNFHTLVVVVDVTDAESVKAMVDAAIKEFGRIDYNVNSAGVSVTNSILFPSLTLLLYKLQLTPSSEPSNPAALFPKVLLNSLIASTISTQGALC